ncbi:MAG TPA: CoA pyrophosphatase [Thermoanaerobaculia bacterium]|nr:CoA pyrophosphatase [Thermoanaerobaculia bacterium]
MTGEGAPDAPSWILEVRQRLTAPPPERLPPELAGEQTRRAAVLVPLYVDAGGLWVLLTRRAEDMPYHRGQIAFPGGSLELGEDPWAAALRESEEEIGLDPKQVLPLGLLDEADTPTGFHVQPVVGAVPYPVETRPAAREVAEIFALPLAAVANPQLIERRDILVDGTPRPITVFHVGKRQIWGVTALVLWNLLERLGIEPA